MLTPHPKNGEDPRYHQIIEQILRWSQGDFTAFLDISDRHDKLDSIMSGLNMLGEELRDKTVSRDILEEKNLELQKANAELDRLVYNVSHNLRAPLANIMGLIYLSQQEDRMDQIQVYLQKQLDSITKIDHIIHDIVNYSQNARLPVIRQMIPFQSIVDRLYQKYDYPVRMEGLAWYADWDPGLQVFTDEKRLEIILHNLISNAIQFKDPRKAQSWIRMTVQNRPNDLHIVISDNGSGIPEATLPHIFDIFISGSDYQSGPGLGLYVVKETLERLKGTIAVSSQLGESTSFEIYIPHTPLINENSEG
ncbi:MAG: HAMP domain-containing sensor histidine kinase [Bacteroidota bacterium]